MGMNEEKENKSFSEQIVFLSLCEMNQKYKKQIHEGFLKHWK